MQIQYNYVREFQSMELSLEINGVISFSQSKTEVLSRMLTFNVLSYILFVVSVICIQTI